MAGMVSKMMGFDTDNEGLEKVDFVPMDQKTDKNVLKKGFRMVRKEGLEPSRHKALVPKTSVYTNFTTSANRYNPLVIVWLE